MTKGIRNKEKRRRAFQRQGGVCHWCGCEMVLRDRNGGGHHLANEATLEHLDDRYSQHRGTHNGEIRVVAACFFCNTARAKRRDAERPLEELWWRSGRRPNVTLREG